MTVQYCTEAMFNASCVQLYVHNRQTCCSMQAMSQTAFALFKFGCSAALAALAAVSAKLHYHSAGVLPSVVGSRDGRGRAQGC